MGKQTKKAGSKFGRFWTKYKLYIIEEYLKSYSITLKNQKFRKIYIDAFAGSGKTELKSIIETKGNGMPKNIATICFIINQIILNFISHKFI